MFLAACMAAASGLGFVMSTFVTPILLLLCGGLLKLALMLGVGGGPARAGLAAIREFSARSNLSFQTLLDQLDQIHGVADALAYGSHLLTFLLPIAMPALVVCALTWLVLRGLFLRTSSADLIQRYGARPARTDDLKERQLANVVDEVAIGSGAPSPKLFVIDSPTINATALGRTPEDGVLLVTRGLLDHLDRDETEAIMARLFTGLVAGDLRVAGGIMAVFHTFGLFLTILDLPIRLSAWAAVGRLARLIVTPRPAAEAVTGVSASLEDSTQAESMPDFNRIFGGLPKPIRIIAQVLLFPWLLFSLVAMLYKIVLFLWSALFLSLPMRALWRNRCYWSDAQTVKLTRAPDSFARALKKVGAVEPSHGVEAHAWLFIGAPILDGRSFTSSVATTRGLPPATGARINRLTAMGAGLQRTSTISWSWVAANPGRAAVIGFLCVLLAPLFAVLLVCVFWLTAVAMTAGLAAGLTVVNSLI